MANSQAIGASLVQFMADGGKPLSENPVSTVVVPPRICLPCLLMPDVNKKCQSMLLNGPENSGKTSMVMNLAYSFSASLDCPCLDMAACRCAASIVFRFSVDRGNPFPPTCHHFPSTDRTHKSPSSYSQFHGEQKSPVNEYLYRDILQRIRTVYVDSVVQMMEELLALRKDDFKFIRCVIIDDLDKIARGSERGASAILQTVAAILETRNSMKSFCGVAPFILITSTASIVAPWIETTASLRLERSPPTWQNDCRSGAPVSHWRATFHDFGLSNDVSRRSSADYMFVNKPSGDVRIYWREGL